jgi:hypothetical protein
VISRPPCSRLIDVVRQELQSSVAPAVSEPEVLGALQMIDSILGSVSRRCDDELAWMHEEIAQIEVAAEALIGTGKGGVAEIQEALDALRAGRSQTQRFAEVQAEYDLAGEVLSRSLEAAFDADAGARTRVEQVLAARLAREVEIRGEFTLAARD